MLYVKNEDKMIYSVERDKTIPEGEKNTLIDFYKLTLIAGVDYINPDENDIQGYVKADRFTEKVQRESISVYQFDECLKDRLEEEGYTKIDKLPTIY